MNPIAIKLIPSTLYLSTPHSARLTDTQQSEETKKHTIKRKHTEQAQPENKTHKRAKICIQKPHIPTAIVPISWTPPSPEARTAFLLMQHRQLTSSQIESSILKRILTPEQFKNLIACKSLYMNYYKKRIIYISPISQEEPVIDFQEKWTELFTSKLSELGPIPKPQSPAEKERYERINYELRYMNRQLSPEHQELLSKLQLGTILYDEYAQLRSTVLAIKNNSLSCSRSLFFPGVISCNSPEHSIARKFLSPIFLLASTTFLAIMPHTLGRSHILTHKQHLLCKQMQEGNFNSLMELDAAASILHHTLTLNRLKELLNNALAIMEQKHILPLAGPINDVTQHNNQKLPFTSSISTEQTTCITHTTTGQYKQKISKETTGTIPIKHHTPIQQAPKLKQPQKQIKVVHLDWSPQTYDQKSALLAIQCADISEIEMKKHTSVLSSILNPKQLAHITSAYNRIPEHKTHRIIHLHTKGIVDTYLTTEEIWNETFTLKKGTIQESISEQIQINKIKFTNFLSQETAQLFEKIESFSITHMEYSKLIENVQSQQNNGYIPYAHIFFPSRSYLNSYTNIHTRAYVPKVFETAARAYFSVLPTEPGIARVLAAKHKPLMEHLVTGRFKSLKDLEYASSILFPVISRRKFSKLLNNAIAIMEDEGVLPVSENFNDPSFQYQNSNERQNIEEIPYTSQSLQTIRHKFPLPISLHPPQIELLTQHEQSDLTTVQTITTSCSYPIQQEVSTLLTRSAQTETQPLSIQSIMLEKTKPTPLTQASTRQPHTTATETETLALEYIAKDFENTCIIETTPTIRNDIVDIKQFPKETEPANVFTQEPIQEKDSCIIAQIFEDDTSYISTATSQQHIGSDTYIPKEETPQTTRSRCTSPTWTDYAPRRVTRSMTTDAVDITQESERTRPIRRRNARSSRITRAISISLIGRYTLKQVKEPQQIDTISNEQKNFMHALGLRSTTQ